MCQPVHLKTACRSVTVKYCIFIICLYGTRVFKVCRSIVSPCVMCIGLRFNLSAAWRLDWLWFIKRKYNANNTVRKTNLQSVCLKREGVLIDVWEAGLGGIVAVWTWFCGSSDCDVWLFWNMNEKRNEDVLAIYMWLPQGIGTWIWPALEWFLGSNNPIFPSESPADDWELKPCYFICFDLVLRYQLCPRAFDKQSGIAENGKL